MLIILEPNADLAQLCADLSIEVVCLRKRNGVNSRSYRKHDKRISVVPIQSTSWINFLKTNCFELTESEIQRYSYILGEQEIELEQALDINNEVLTLLQIPLDHATLIVTHLHAIATFNNNNEQNEKC